MQNSYFNLANLSTLFCLAKLAKLAKLNFGPHVNVWRWACLDGSCVNLLKLLTP
jgi:hypothetical protein